MYEFDYNRPASLDDAARGLGDADAKLVAGGMTIVGEAETPQSSIDAILEVHPDVVVLDVRLEGGSGLQVLRAVHDADPEIGFVVFSNNSSPAYRKRYLGEGADRFLDKNDEFDQLVVAVTDASHYVH